jgi:hypothetical protein
MTGSILTAYRAGSQLANVATLSKMMAMATAPSVSGSRADINVEERARHFAYPPRRQRGPAPGHYGLQLLTDAKSHDLALIRSEGRAHTDLVRSLHHRVHQNPVKTKGEGGDGREN